MSKHKNGATVYWIDPISNKLLSYIIMEYQLKKGATYLSEAMWKMPDGVEHYEIILLSKQGTLFETHTLNKLKERTNITT